jgi:hypothetical protein
MTNAIVFASSVTTGATGTGRKNAILVIGNATTFYDAEGETIDSTVTLNGDYVISENKTLIVDAGKTLCLEDGSLTIADHGAVTGEGSLTGEGMLINDGSVAISLATVTDTGPYTYTGEAITPELFVKIAGTTLAETTHYTVDVDVSDSINANPAITYTIMGKPESRYTGTKSGSFAIEPAEIASVNVTGIARHRGACQEHFEIAMIREKP